MTKLSLNFKKTVFLLFLLLIIFYAVLFLNTNSVMKYAKEVFSGEAALEKVIDSPLYIHYYPKNEPELYKVDLKLHRTFVFHNFSDGYIWIKYDVAHIDKSGYEFSGSRNISARWKIHKENGKWKVVEVKEDP